MLGTTVRTKLPRGGAVARLICTISYQKILTLGTVSLSKGSNTSKSGEQVGIRVVYKFSTEKK